MTLAQTRTSGRPAPDNRTWSEYLEQRVNPAWRPGEYDHETGLFVPNVASTDNIIAQCLRPGCGSHLSAGIACVGCLREFKASGSTTIEQWLEVAEPKQRNPVEHTLQCQVPACERLRKSRGLCASHIAAFRPWAKTHGGTINEWVAARHPTGFRPLAKCVAGCGREVFSTETQLCKSHRISFVAWSDSKGLHRDDQLPYWLSHVAEPLLDETNRVTYARATVTAFALLPEPLRWELLLAVQERERVGGRRLPPIYLRQAYKDLRERGVESVVGQQALGIVDVPKARLSLHRVWQHYIDEAHRDWSGTDDRDQDLIFLRDVLPPSKKQSVQVGPKAKVDLSKIHSPWIKDAIRLWVTEAADSPNRVRMLVNIWLIAEQVLLTRGTPLRALGARDIDAVVKAISDRDFSAAYEVRAVSVVDELIEFARRREEFAETWGRIPVAFRIDPRRHKRPRSRNERSRSADDEPFRFVPQPVVEHLMSNLHLAQRRQKYRSDIDPYLTAEMRAMLYLHERCGRRTVETVRLSNDCISYDHEGAPYLEWTRGKPPYSRGPRLPIHQETHDVIRQWQEIKREQGIESDWLFPKIGANSTSDTHWHTGYLLRRLTQFIRAVMEHAPLTHPVEGIEGNLVHFDLESIDTYSFRHAFAQRYADATDEAGRQTTPPDVLQSLMGHASYDTTMAYYEVSARRRKKSLAALPARRLDLNGEVVAIDRERDGFTRVAVTLGHCTEPQNVASHGHGCLVNHACESCPFFLVDPLEREGMDAKRHALKVQLERARAIDARPHLMDHLQGRINDTTRIIDGIDRYIATLPEPTRETIQGALNSMAEIRRLASAPRTLDLRTLSTDTESISD